MTNQKLRFYQSLLLKLSFFIAVCECHKYFAWLSPSQQLTVLKQLYSSMHSTQLGVFAQSNLLPFHSTMKGSVIKQTSTKTVQTHRHPKSAIIYLESHSQQLCSSPKVGIKVNEETNMLYSATHKYEIRQNITKTASISQPNKKSSGSVVIQNYVRKQPKTEEAIAHHTKTSPKDSINEKTNRYQTGNLFDLQSQARMSLSSFQQNFKAMRLKRLVSKTEEIMHLKLEGQTCKTNQILRKDQNYGKQKHNLYITQQSAQLNFDKSVQKQCNTARAARARSIISRLHQQELKQKLKSDQENKTQKNKIRSASATNKKHERRPSANLRQKLHMNIINFVEQKQIENHIIDRKAPFGEHYSRFVRNQNMKGDQVCGKDKMRLQFSQRVYTNSEVKDLEINSRKSKMQDYQQERKGSPRKQINSNSRLIQSSAQKKLNQRKNLLRNYTFKKQGINPNSRGKQQQGSPQDFYVSGWNNSTQFERRQLIMLI